jgi:hypothetical protein
MRSIGTASSKKATSSRSQSSCWSMRPNSNWFVVVASSQVWVNVLVVTPNMMAVFADPPSWRRTM